ncbi:putative Cell wall integrity protein scw1 [Nannochloris sp. 'desiccata']|nr:hypothetical protein KSW81_004913 [Chlorella desiccata (nom. nud.)]KAH7618106.1 putative Cell wall integrity protein scw1 [Chlorella desiccata (nom. nud.)]
MNFPEDAKERELNNLLLFFPGYQASVMLWGEHGIEGRAIFVTPQDARTAINKLDGVEFESGRMLKSTMASEELDIGQEFTPPQPTHITKRSKSAEGLNPATPTGMVPPPPPFGPPLPPPPHGGAAGSGGGGMVPFPSPFPGHPGTTPVATRAPGMLQGVPPPPRYAPVKNEKDNPPCNTLFIGNLGENIIEDELRAVFGPQPGFQQLKVVRSPRGISAFIEFSDVTTATSAHESQQGLILGSSDRGPIRVQYSKNPFGRKREGAAPTQGQMVGGVPPPPPGLLPATGVPLSTMYGPYAVHIPQPVLSPGYIYSTAPSGGGAMYPAQVLAPHQGGMPPPPPPSAATAD